MTDRAAILSAIRSTRKSSQPSAESIAAAAAALVANPQSIQPDFSGQSLLDRFVAKATSERVTATVARLSGLAQVPQAVLNYMRRVGQQPTICVQDCAPLAALDWSAFDCAAALDKDGGTAVSLAEYGIAETGSVVFRSGARSPILLNFLPLYHIVILPAGRLIGHTEDLWPHLGGAQAPQSRVLTIVTGTSGTADIEARNVRGAHGPKHMHILIVPP